MKKLLFLFWVFSPIVAFSQDLPVNPETGKVNYTAIIDAKGSKEELFSRAKHWVMTTFSSAEEMIQEEDQDQGRLTIRGLSLIDYTIANTSSIEVPMYFSLTLSIQDHQYHYQFTDIYFKLAPTEDSSHIIPMEETLLGKKEKRILLSEHVTSSGLELTTEEFQEELKKADQQYKQFQSKGEGTIIGISKLLKQGMLPSSE